MPKASMVFSSVSRTKNLGLNFKLINLCLAIFFLKDRIPVLSYQANI